MLTCSRLWMTLPLIFQDGHSTWKSLLQNGFRELSDVHAENESKLRRPFERDRHSAIGHVTENRGLFDFEPFCQLTESSVLSLSVTMDCRCQHLRRFGVGIGMNSRIQRNLHEL